jgi:hypothetical protein
MVGWNSMVIKGWTFSPLVKQKQGGLWNGI